MVLFGLPPGIPALILLILMISITTITCILKYCPQSSNEKFKWFINASPKTVRSKATAVVAFPFWIWAVYNVIQSHQPDLGAISFLFVLISCTTVITIGHHCNSIMLMLSNALVVLNYALPLFFMSFPLSYNIYFISGVIYWAIMCIWNWKAETENIPVSSSYNETVGLTYGTGRIMQSNKLT